MAILDVQGITKRFGGLTAVNNVSFSVEKGAIVSVIGPNGAGKSTLFKLISSFLTPTSGTISYNGHTITGLAPHEVARTRNCPDVSGDDNLQGNDGIAERDCRPPVAVLEHRVLGIYFSSAAARADEERFHNSATEILDYLGLSMSSTCWRATFRMATCGHSESQSPWLPNRTCSCWMSLFRE